MRQLLMAFVVAGTMTAVARPAVASHDLEEAYTQLLIYGIPMAGAVLIPVNGILTLTGHAHKGGAYLSFAAAATELGAGIYGLTSADSGERLTGGVLLGLAALNGGVGAWTFIRADKVNAAVTPGVMTPEGLRPGFSLTGEF